MFTVGLISKECIKTYSYDSLEEARKYLKSWKNVFICNNSVESYTTIIEKDRCGTIESAKYIFRLEHSLDLYYMFLSKNKN